MKGKSRMPLAIMLMGVVFNVLNGLMQGEWLFYLATEGLYTDAWLSTPSFWFGIILFFIGMGINLHSDSVIRHLRKQGDTRHYLPQKGMYRYVTSGNYFGELVEWIGFAVPPVRLLHGCLYCGRLLIWLHVPIPSVTVTGKSLVRMR